MALSQAAQVLNDGKLCAYKNMIQHFQVAVSGLPSSTADTEETTS